MQIRRRHPLQKRRYIFPMSKTENINWKLHELDFLLLNWCREVFLEWCGPGWVSHSNLSHTTPALSLIRVMQFLRWFQSFHSEKEHGQKWESSHTRITTSPLFNLFIYVRDEGIIIIPISLFLNVILKKPDETQTLVGIILIWNEKFLVLFVICQILGRWVPILWIEPSHGHFPSLPLWFQLRRFEDWSIIMVTLILKLTSPILPIMLMKWKLMLWLLIQGVITLSGEENPGPEILLTRNYPIISPQFSCETA